MTNFVRVVSSHQNLTKGGIGMSRRILAFAAGASLIVGTNIDTHAASIVVTNQALPTIVTRIVPTTLRLDQLLIPQESGGTQAPATEAPACNLTERIEAARSLLEPIAVSIGATTHRYTERRAGSNMTFRDSEKTIALALMNSESCELSTTIITKRGDQLIAKPGFVIEPVTRSNGIRWNNWATEFRITEPAHTLVVSLKYPYQRDQRVARTVKSAKGKTRTVYETKSVTIPIYYTPYSRELHVPELVQGGEEHLSSLAERAYADLRERGVTSYAVPGMLVANVDALRPEYVIRLAPIEHMDLTEFLLDPSWTTERIHVVIGANLERVATYTCSKASACGLMQFTKGTYGYMRKLYPAAGLIESFEDGARDQFNAMKAALLLHDHNSSQLIDAFGPDILNDPRLEEYLAAAYNTGVARVIAVVSAAKKKKVSDWADASGARRGSKLLPETKGYIAKLRFLRDSWQQEPLAQAEIKTPND
jgi:hypothetical protein